MTDSNEGGTGMLTPAEAARLMGVSRNTLVRWEERRLITTYRTLGGHRRYSEAELRGLMAAGTLQRQDS